jgi:hypothetical protein
MGTPFPGDDDDDDIEEKLDDLIDEISQLNQTFRAFITQGAEQSDDDDGGSDQQGDQWRNGNNSPMVVTEEEYRSKRRIAANSQTTTLPFYGPNVFDTKSEKIEAYVDSFIDGYDSVESIYATLSEDDFDKFGVRLVVKLLSEVEDLNLRVDLIEELDPGAAFFGLRVVETVNPGRGAVERRDKGVVIDGDSSPISYTRYYNDHYYAGSDPVGVLRLDQPNIEGQVQDVQGQKPIPQVNRDLATAIFKRQDKSLSESDKRLVPDEVKDTND